MSPGVDRGRLAKMFGRLGSDNAGERSSALEQIGKALAGAGLSWSFVTELVAKGELPSGDREKLLRSLTVTRLRDGLVCSWAMGGGEASFVRDVLARCESEARSIDVTSMKRAIEVSDTARRRAR